MSMSSSHSRAVSLRRLPLAALLSLAFAGASQAQSLVDIYEMARGYDAKYLAAKYQYEANLAKADQGIANLLPSVGASAGVVRTNRDITYSPAPPPGASASDYYFNTQTAGIKATQPLYRPANLAKYQKSQKSLVATEASLAQAEQDLIVRVSQAYFDVLVAEEALASAQAQKSAVSEQLASAKRNFEVGTATIADTHDAQAQFDRISAQEIQADNDLRVKKAALEQLVGKSNLKPQKFNTATKLPNVGTEGLDNWLSTAMQTSPAIQLAKTNLELAKLDTEIATADHKPAVDFNLEYGRQKNLNATTVASSPGYNQTINSTSAGVSVTLPLYAGMSVQNRVREAVALEDKSRQDLEDAQRQVSLSTQTAFLNLQSGWGQVKAYEAAELSTATAVASNKLGYQVGVKTNLDVLTSQSQLYQTKRDLAKARYDVLVGQLRLRQAAGVLKAEDLKPINALLAP